MQREYPKTAIPVKQDEIVSLIKLHILSQNNEMFVPPQQAFIPWVRPSEP